jgi:MoaF-like
VVDVQDFAERVVYTHLMLEDDRFVRMTGTMRETAESRD